MLEDKMKAMLLSAGKSRKDMAEALGITVSACQYWLKKVPGNLPAFFAFCKLCGCEIQLCKRDSKEIIKITQKDIDEDESVQRKKRHTIKE